MKGSAVLQRTCADPPKAKLMSHFAGLVIEGLAEWAALANGDIQLKLQFGAIFSLGEATIKRVK